MLVFIFKALCLVVYAIWARASLPRYRIDQILSQNWKSYIFFLITFYTWLLILNIIFII